MVSRAPLVRVEGTFERHVSQKWSERAFEGSASGGRWNAPGSFPVIYLGRPRAAVVVEAYRHLVDDVHGMTPERVRGRLCFAAMVNASQILDLRTDEALLTVGITREDTSSAVGDYDECQAVGHAAHQLGYHGILAPAASGLGDTLALFPRHLPAEETPVPQQAPQRWEKLPADPRRLRVIRGQEDLRSG